MKKVDIEHVMSVGMAEHEKAISSTAYTGDHVTKIYYKSSTERKLVLKAQVLFAVLAALIYFVAYLVSTCSPTLTPLKLATAVGTVAVFLPSFVKAFGYSPRTSLLVLEDWFSSSPVQQYKRNYSQSPHMLVRSSHSWASAQYQIVSTKKGVFLVASLSVACLGYIIILTNVSIQVKVFATCLVTSGLYPSVVLVAIWVGMNTGGFMKRAATWALAEILGQSFSILGMRMSIPTHHATSRDTRLCWRSSPLLS